MNDLIKKIDTNLNFQQPEYQSMLLNIQEKMPAFERDSSNFYKSHSQFMQCTLDVTALTPIRSIKHSLAEIHKTKLALTESFFALKKKQVSCKKKQEQLKKTKNVLDAELLEIEISEIISNEEEIKKSMQGALRKLNFFMNQHENLLKKIGKTEISEEDFEREENRYHIMTAMKQALIAARSRSGVIDEGNLIYIFELGINGCDAQGEVFAYLEMEEKLAKEGKIPTHEMTMRWLEACADKWENSAEIFATRRGFNILDKTSLNQIEHKI